MSWYKFSQRMSVDSPYYEPTFHRETGWDSKSVGGYVGEICGVKIGDIVTDYGHGSADQILNSIYVVEDIFVDEEDECMSSVRARKYDIDKKTFNLFNPQKYTRPFLANSIETIPPNNLEYLVKKSTKVRPTNLYQTELQLISF